MFCTRYHGSVSGLIIAAFCVFGLPAPAAEAAAVLNIEEPESGTFPNFCTATSIPLPRSSTQLC
jgi:hypothetical protein